MEYCNGFLMVITMKISPLPAVLKYPASLFYSVQRCLNFNFITFVILLRMYLSRIY